MRFFPRLALFALLVAGAPARSESGFTLEIAGAKIAVTFAANRPAQAVVSEWISESAKAVAAYYGKFPVSELRILVVPVEGGGVKSGKSYGYNGAAIKVSLGKSTTRAQLRDDWVMPHEMVHLAFPSVPDAHVWIEEGLATYVEPWARLMTGNLSEKEVWSELVHGLPKGLPRAGDEGLDRTHTWGRTYWGGALFCLLADIEIRQRTANKHGLRDGLRAIVAAGGTIEKQWPLAKAFATADAVIGVPVLTELYEQMKETSVSPDLHRLWSELGIIAKDGAIRFDDSAPLAHVRQAMVSDYSRREVGTIR